MKPIQYDDRTARRLQRLVKERARELILPPFWQLHGPLGACAMRWVKVNPISKEVDGVVILEPEPHTVAAPIDSVAETRVDDWWHLSVSRANRVPTWDELMQAKEVFLGLEAHAVQVLPPRSQHVNIMPHCLHLFSRMDGTPSLPDFRQVGGGL